MHHFIYPEKDTFITNTINSDNSNFGLDEILRVGTYPLTVKTLSPTTIIEISQSTSICVAGFSGSIIDATLYGTASMAIGTVSSSAAIIDTTYFTGDVTGSSITGYSGSISGSFTGSISGSLLTAYLDYFNGDVIDFTGKIITGSIVGVDILRKQNLIVSENVYINRALIQFDLTSISKSISDGDIVNPRFTLKMNAAREEQLPIQYSIYAYPISESWVMGDGYLSDNGSSIGASWNYRDYDGGITWSLSGSTYNSSLVASQSFNYQVGDISMEVTNIVNDWIYSGSQNNGFVIINGDEFEATSSGMGLHFFSKDTNTIYEPVLDVAWNDVTWITGSITTSSINISSISAGLSASILSGSNANIVGSIYGGFTGLGNISISSSISYSIDTELLSTASFITNYANGMISIMGVNGSIISMSIVGNFSGSTSSSIDTITTKCQSCIPQFNAGFNYTGGQSQTQYEGHDIYGWGHPFNEFNQYDWTSDHLYQEEFGPGFSGSSCGPYQETSSFLMGTLIDGLFSGSTFTSSFINGYILGYGNLTGSWSVGMINDAIISSNYPFKPFYPNAVTVAFYGDYVNGSAFGSITQVSQSISSSFTDLGTFDGVFTAGPLIGMHIHAPFTGSILTSSYFYTSSIDLTSLSLTPIDVKKSFTPIIQNVPSSVKAGDIIRINVFGRQEFPLKNFNRQTQFSQHLIPQYLPSSSYYAIKDNETEEIILNFDTYTQISCDQYGNYFLLDTTSYPQERYFRLLIRVEQSGSIYTFDKDNIFKIVR